MELVIANNNIFYQIDFLGILLGILYKMASMDSNSFGKSWVKQIKQISLMYELLRVLKILTVLTNIKGIKFPKSAWSTSEHYKVHIGKLWTPF